MEPMLIHQAPGPNTALVFRARKNDTINAGRGPLGPTNLVYRFATLPSIQSLLP